MSGNLTELLELFGIVTVMNVHVYTLKESEYGTKKLSPENFENTGICLDTLKISNIKQSSPKKTFSVGMLNMPLIQIGKNITIEIQDALCHRDVLEYFCGVELTKNFDASVAGTVTGFVIGNNFSSPICLEGSTCIVDLNGNKQDLWITIPCFLHKSVLNLMKLMGLHMIPSDEVNLTPKLLKR